MKNKSVLEPYLNFNGDAAAAMKFYQSVLGGELHMQTFGEAKMAKTPVEKDRIVHARLETGELSFMASDGLLDRPVKFGDNISMSISGTNEKELTEYFKKLSKDGKTNMPLEKQFWGDTFGMFTDKFGIQWMINISSQQQQKK